MKHFNVLALSLALGVCSVAKTEDWLFPQWNLEPHPTKENAAKKETKADNLAAPADFSPETLRALNLWELQRWYGTNFGVGASKAKPASPQAPYSLDPSANPLGTEEGVLGSEVNNGGNEVENRYRVRGFYLVEKMRTHNRRYAGHPKHQIPDRFIEAIHHSVKHTRVFAWEEKPRWNGMPRNAGIFPDPDAPDQWAIAIYRPTFEKWIARGANFDENVLHEYALAAGLEDDYYHITAPLFARIATTPLSQPLSEKGLGNGRTEQLYFRGDAYVPKTLMVQLGERDSVRLWNALYRPQIVLQQKNAWFQLRESPAIDWKEVGDGFRGLVVPDKDGEPMAGIQCYRADKGASCNVWYWDVHPKGGSGDRVELDRALVRAILGRELGARLLTLSMDGAGVVDFDPQEQRHLFRTEFKTGDGTFKVACEQLNRGDGSAEKSRCEFSSKLDAKNLEILEADDTHLMLLEWQKQQGQLVLAEKYREAVKNALASLDAPPLQTVEALQPFLASFRLALAGKTDWLREAAKNME